MDIRKKREFYEKLYWAMIMETSHTIEALQKFLEKIDEERIYFEAYGEPSYNAEKLFESSQLWHEK